MISLSKHIELLLLEHDCVIAPGLGGFIANHASARYNDEGDNMFLPPFRNVCFNRNLQANDGLLVQAYMNVYDASYPAAYKQMSNDIEEVLDAIDLEGEYELAGIGVLSKDISGHITFAPSSVGGILTPSLYGLYSVNIKSKEEAERERQIQKALQATNVLPIQTEQSEKQQAEIRTIAAAKANKEDKQKSNGKHSKLVDIAVACVASVLLFFVFSYPTGNSEATTDTYAASTVNIAPETKNKPAAVTVAAPKEVPAIVKTETTPEVKEEVKEEVTPAATNAAVANSEVTVEKQEARYTIVLASCVRKDNAEYLINRLNKAGFPHAEFVRGGRMNRVIYSAYSTFDEASKELLSLKKESSLFKEAWVYRNKR